MAISATDPPASTTPAAFKTWAQAVKDDLTALDGATFDSVTVGANSMALANGSAGFSAAIGPFPYWQLDPAAFEAVAGMVELPGHWTHYDVDIYWTNVSSTSGDVDWEFFPGLNPLKDGAVVTNSGAALPSSGVVAAPTTLDVVKVSTLATSVEIAADGHLVGFKIARRGSNAADTLANDVRLMAVRFRNPT